MQKIEFKPEHGQEIVQTATQKITHLDISPGQWGKLGEIAAK